MKRVAAVAVACLFASSVSAQVLPHCITIERRGTVVTLTTGVFPNVAHTFLAAGEGDDASVCESSPELCRTLACGLEDPKQCYETIIGACYTYVSSHFCRPSDPSVTKLSFEYAGPCLP